MSNYRTKEEITSDLIAIYMKAKRAVDAEGPVVHEINGRKIHAGFTVMKDCVAALNRMGAIDSIEDKAPQLDLD